MINPYITETGDPPIKVGQAGDDYVFVMVGTSRIKLKDSLGT